MTSRAALIEAKALVGDMIARAGFLLFVRLASPGLFNATMAALQSLWVHGASYREKAADDSC
jgi:hypothetical protein